MSTTEKKVLESIVTETKETVDKQHLDLKAVLKIFEGLSYAQTTIVSTVDLEDFQGVEICSNETLKQALKNVVDSNNIDQKFIIFRVNAETKSFSNSENENNHYVGLYFGDNGNSSFKLTYIDSTGSAVSSNIKSLINSVQGFENASVISSNIALQYTNPSKQNSVYIMGGNDYDCGVLLPLIALMIRDGKNITIKLDEENSTALGQKLRALLNGGKFDTNEAINAILESASDNDSKDKEIKPEKEQKVISVRIPSGKYISNNNISALVKKINKKGDLVKNLMIFRLASAHRDLTLLNSIGDANAILVNLRIKFLTKSNVEVEHTIPILVNDREGHSYYSRSKIDENAFSEFYKSIIKEVQDIIPQHHYHSEPFLAYYLCSKQGKNSIAQKFKKKGLTVPTNDGKYLKTNVKKILGVSIDFHSTKVTCFRCAPFLRAATPELLKAIYWALALGDLPEKDRLQEIDFNISANKNFNSKNIQAAIFDHIPVSEEQESILTNTENLLGKKKSNLQRVGELSNRTFFISGSTILRGDKEKLVEQDKEDWKKVETDAGVKILYALRKNVKKKNLTGLQDRLEKIELNRDDKKEKKLEKTSTKLKV